MFGFILRRVLWIFPVLITVGLVTWIVMRAAPGGPFDIDPNQRGITPTTRRLLEARFGLDKPMWRQFTRYMFVDRDIDLETGQPTWVCGAICGNLGPTYSSRGTRTVEQTLFAQESRGRPSRFYFSARLGLQALILAVVVGIPLGVIAALKQNTIVDYVSLFVSTIFTVLPSFIVGLLLLLLAVRVLNESDTFVDIFGKFQVNPRKWTGTIQPWILPTLSLGFASMAFITRLTRASVLEVIRQDYIRTARAKGLAGWTVITRHVLKNSLIPVVTILGPALAGLVTGSFFTETIFNVPGMGRALVQAVGQRDYSMIMGTSLFFAFAIAAANLSVDLVYGFLDPRIKVGK
jgi:oligopeptide transport system permease protein